MTLPDMLMAWASAFWTLFIILSILIPARVLYVYIRRNVLHQKKSRYGWVYVD